MKKWSTSIALALRFQLIVMPQASVAQKADWLIQPTKQKASIVINKNTLTIDNSLVRRTFILSPNLSCISYTNLTNGQELLRSIEPEAKVVLNNHLYNVGGLSGQKEKAYLRIETENKLQKNGVTKSRRRTNN